MMIIMTSPTVKFYRNEDGLFELAPRPPSYLERLIKSTYCVMPPVLSVMAEWSFWSNSLDTLQTICMINVLNILCVRMQNVDYVHNRSFSKAVKDVITIDKHRMFYRGLPAITISALLLKFTYSNINYFRNPEKPMTQYVWPLVFIAGTLLVHPFLLVCLRV